MSDVQLEAKPLPPVANVAAPGVPYFTPAQIPPAGTAIDPQPNGNPIPKVFQPLKVRDTTLHNRILLSPLCQYSSSNGHVTDWHLTHLGGIIQRGPGLVITEATAVSPEGRISPEDAGIWSNGHVAPWNRITEFAHSQGQKIAIQIAHAGRKATTVAPWIDRKATATVEVGGWPDHVIGPSPLTYDPSSPVPKEMTLGEIDSLKRAYKSAAVRARKAGFDAIEIHAAHGYLLHSFYSPFSNTRTDAYGGSFTNRVRLLLEIVDVIRAEIPSNMPLLIRYTGSDWLEHLPDQSWRVEDAARLGKLLADTGKVDMLDISSGGLSSQQQITGGPGYHAPFSRAVKAAVAGTGVSVGIVGMITSGKQAEGFLQDGTADFAVVGKAFIKNPALVWSWAEELGTEVRVANQIGWGFGQRPGRGL